MRRRLHRLLKLVSCFNPRICKRCDHRDEILNNPSLVSIHASVKDATDGDGINVDFTHVSIHASVKDATTYRERLDSFNPVSIHASVKDATTKNIKADTSKKVSIHASVKDATYGYYR